MSKSISDFDILVFYYDRLVSGRVIFYKYIFMRLGLVLLSVFSVNNLIVNMFTHSSVFKMNTMG